jgi:peptide/nickel transport system substrate-binding protein
MNLKGRNLLLKRLVTVAVALALTGAGPDPGSGQLRFSVHNEPKTFNPVLVEDTASELIRYITGGFLIRVNRVTQELEPELAEKWTVSHEGKRITFQLRTSVKFSDGTPLDSADVAYTMKTLFDPALHSPVADAFGGAAATPAIAIAGPDSVMLTFPKPLASLPRLFDQVAIMSSRSPLKEKAVLGPFSVSEYRSGSHVLLARNPEYWKRDSQRRRLPYLDSVRIQIQSNRDLEALAFSRGELDLITPLDSSIFEQLRKQSSASVEDLGPSMSSEFLWFNQVRSADIPDFKKSWFRSRAFRNAISMAINRDDICRIVYEGHAAPAAGPFPKSNQLWYARNLKPHRSDPEAARKLLLQAGFRLNGGILSDAAGNRVSFSLITNGGNKNREKIAALIQNDLRAIGVELKIATLDFGGLLSRITRTYQYEACLLGLVNVDVDPNGQMNVWLSSSSNHQWNPSQKTPATEWEAEIDRAMQAQANEPDEAKRKLLFDRVQEIARVEEPFIYLVHPNALVAVSPRLKNVAKTPLSPDVLSFVDRIAFAR